MTRPGGGLCHRCPYCDGLRDRGSLDQYWTTHSTTTGRVRYHGQHAALRQLPDDHGQHHQRHLRQNEAWLQLNLSGQSQVELYFWWKEFGDETHTQDGVFFSSNGGAASSRSRT